MLRSHRELLLNYFRARGTVSAGVTEGLNNKLKVTSKRASGFRTFRAIEVSLYHTLGHLPEPTPTHRFWWRAQIGNVPPESQLRATSKPCSTRPVVPPLMLRALR